MSFPETDEPGNVIEIHLAEDTTPALVNASLNLAADFFLRRFMGVNSAMLIPLSVKYFLTPMALPEGEPG